MNSLPPDFLRLPVAHRAYHGAGRPENSLSAVRSAAEAGYAIEIDVQLTADEEAVVFHDYELNRLTGETGPLRDRTAEELRQIPLRGADDRIPSLAQVLEAVGGRVPLLVEIKDQDGQMGPAVGKLERATAAELAGYEGPVAVMSFNPHSLAEMARMAPQIPRGLTTCGFPAEDWPLPEETRARLRGIPDFDRVGACFISHQHTDLGNAAVLRLRERGVPVLCWTVRSAETEAIARRGADNITFEYYPAALPGA